MLDNLKIAKVDDALLERVIHQINIKTKPPGSLGQIEKLALQIAGAQASETPSADPARLLLFAGDHGLVK